MEAPVSPVVGFKTVAPPLDGTIERPAALSSLRRPTAQAKWLLGPSGSGKSTLVASAVKANGKRCVWYRLDQRDDDPAFLYAGLAAAIEQQVPIARDLPLFADDDRENEPGFAERFFAAVVRNANGVAFVFDDAHNASSSATTSSPASSRTIAALSCGARHVRSNNSRRESGMRSSRRASKCR